MPKHEVGGGTYCINKIYCAIYSACRFLWLRPKHQENEILFSLSEECTKTHKILVLITLLIATLIALLQRRFGDDFVGSVREIIGGDGNSVSDGGSYFNIHSSIILRSLLSLSLHREHVLSPLHVHGAAQR